MAKSTRSSGKLWWAHGVKEIRKLAKGNTPTGVMSIKLGRTEPAIFSKDSQEGVSLKPTIQSPYGPRKKR